MLMPYGYQELPENRIRMTQILPALFNGTLMTLIMLIYTDLFMFEKSVRIRLISPICILSKIRVIRVLSLAAICTRP